MDYLRKSAANTAISSMLTDEMSRLNLSTRFCPLLMINNFLFLELKLSSDELSPLCMLRVNVEVPPSHPYTTSQDLQYTKLIS